MNASNTNNFCNVNTDGSANNNNANWSNGFAPGFKNNLGPERVAKCEAAPQTLKENLTLGDWPAMRGLHSLNHHSIRRPGRCSSQAPYRSPRPHGPGLTRSAAPRFRTKPAALGFRARGRGMRTELRRPCGRPQACMAGDLRRRCPGSMSNRYAATSNRCGRRRRCGRSCDPQTARQTERCTGGILHWRQHD